MATIKKFEEIIAWQKARDLCAAVWEITLKKPFTSDFPLRDQINRSSGSIMDNIAEGYGRGGNKEFLQFLFYAKGSIDELSSQIYRAYDRGYLQPEALNTLKEQITEVTSLIIGLIKYLQKSEFKGIKFNQEMNL